jgi:hypothetical protein
MKPFPATSLMAGSGYSIYHESLRFCDSNTETTSTNVQWYLGIRPLWNKSKLVYVLFGREKFCLVYDLCLEYDSCAKTCMSQNES